MQTTQRAPKCALFLLSLAWGWLAFERPAWANDRHFTYTYETAVLPPDGRELELWTTWRTGRDNYYSRFDHRVEFEVGLTQRLQTAFYLNFRGLTAEDELGARVSSFDYDGISSEWKYKLSDPVADPIGLALYGEGSAAPNEYELEVKLLADKQLGPVLLALNLVGEIEWELEADETERQLVLAPVLGAAYLLSASASVGVEVRSHNELVSGKWEHSALFAGPVASYATESFWAALTFLPQVADLKHGGLDTEEHERFETRLLFGWHL